MQQKRYYSINGLYSNATVTAHFRTAINYEVTITSPTNGTVTVSYNDGSAQSFTSGSRKIAEGTTLTVTTTPANGYQFSAWTNDGAASVTVDDTKTIGVTFAPILYTITYNGLEGATNAGNPTSYNVETATIVLADPGTRDGVLYIEREGVVYNAQGKRVEGAF